LVGVFREEFFFHLDALAALAKDFVAIGFGGLFDEGGCVHETLIWFLSVVTVVGKAAEDSRTPKPRG
jgi:hypothetical protein